jgi:hypothetical protein
VVVAQLTVITVKIIEPQVLQHNVSNVNY